MCYVQIRCACLRWLADKRRSLSLEYDQIVEPSDISLHLFVDMARMGTLCRILSVDDIRATGSNMNVSSLLSSLHHNVNIFTPSRSTILFQIQSGIFVLSAAYTSTL